MEILAGFLIALAIGITGVGAGSITAPLASALTIVDISQNLRGNRENGLARFQTNGNVNGAEERKAAGES